MATSFRPRVAMMLAGGFLLFVLLAFLYSLPVMSEPLPPGASADYITERVRAHLAGKIKFFFFGAFAIVAAIAWWTGRRRATPP